MEDFLTTEYDSSHALVIGIDDYEHCSPLGFAVSDAQGIRACLVDKLGFPEGNVKLLENKKATKQNIIDAYMAFTLPTVGLNDRLIFFYAGHGHTIRAGRGDVGFLIPHDGHVEQLGSLLRWDELTRNADLIPAKHILFFMDSCYGGLAITRSQQPGSMRFLRDMLRRRSRQVVTAGKANEVVADEGGPRVNHSVFTGHLLDALEGKAANDYGLITANSVMHYVYRMVGSDAESHQTPHFGHLDGDGDCILQFPTDYKAATDFGDGTIESDELVAVQSPAGASPIKTVSVVAKQLLTDERRRIALHDLVALETRSMIAFAQAPELSPQGKWSESEFSERLQLYETATSNLMDLQALLCYWGQPCNLDTISFSLRRYAASVETLGGMTMWLNLRWYPMQLLTYTGGIAAIAANNYENLSALFTTQMPGEVRRRGGTVVCELPNKMIDLSSGFKTLPERERQYVPISEYLHTFLQPILDDLLFLGGDYEELFDQFEVMYALEHIAQTGRGWAPAGRFAWKRHRDHDFIAALAEEADKAKDSWPPIVAGLFGGSYEAFTTNLEKLNEFLGKLHWA